MERKMKLTETTSLIFEKERMYLKGVNGLYDLMSKNYSIFLLPLLEHNLEDFYSNLPIDRTYNVDNVILNLIKCPFENKMDYWSDKALDWLQGYDQSYAFLDWAKEINIDWMSQKGRHKFQKILKVR